MADDLVVREWDCSPSAGGTLHKLWALGKRLPLSKAAIEHNAVARAYLERDAQLAALDREYSAACDDWAIQKAELRAQLAAMTAERDAHKDHGWAALNERDDARREVLCLRDKLTASEAARVSDLNTLDSVCAELGIQDSDDTPAEAIQELKRDLERERVKTSKLATTLQALLGTTPEERQTPSIWFPRVDAARAALHEFAEIFALAEAGKAGEP